MSCQLHFTRPDRPLCIMRRKLRRYSVGHLFLCSWLRSSQPWFGCSRERVTADNFRSPSGNLQGPSPAAQLVRRVKVQEASFILNTREFTLKDRRTTARTRIVLFGQLPRAGAKPSPLIGEVVVSVEEPARPVLSTIRSRCFAGCVLTVGPSDPRCERPVGFGSVRRRERPEMLAPAPLGGHGSVAPPSGCGRYQPFL